MSKEIIKLVYFWWWSYSKVLYDVVATGHPFRAPIWRQSPDRSDGHWVPSDSDRSWDLPCLQHLLCHCHCTLAQEHMRRDADCQHAFPGPGVAFADWSPAQRSAHTRVFHGGAARGLARTSRSPKPAGPFNSGLGLNKFGIFYYIRCRKQVLFHVYEYEITTIFSKPNI